MADFVHAAARTGCDVVFRTSAGDPLHYRNAYWSYHLASADEALCAAEHIGHIFSRRSTRPGLLQSLLEDIFLELRSEPTENRSMSLLSLDPGRAEARSLRDHPSTLLPGPPRRGIYITDYRRQSQIIL